jgi:uncharacterized membrane protein YqjE
MAILTAFFRFLSKSVGKIVQAIFGWAVLAIFGEVKENEKSMLSGTVGLAAAWPLLLVGVAVPKIAAFVLGFIPIPKWMPSGTIRIVWIALALAAPVIVGAVVAHRAATPATGTSWPQRFWQGIRVTAAIGSSFLIVLFGAPARRIAAAAKGYKDEHIPLIVTKEDYHPVAEEVRRALEIGKIEVHRAEAPWLTRTVTNVLRSVGGKVIADSLPADVEYFQGKSVSVTLSSSGVTLQGKEEELARAHGFISEAMTFTPALQTTDVEAQVLERELKDIWRVFQSEPEEHRHSGILLSRVEQVASELAERSLPYDQWQVSYRELLQVARAIHAEPQLLARSTEESRMETMHNRNGHHPEVKKSPRELSIGELIGAIVPEIKTLIQQEVTLAKAELKADLQSEINMAKFMGIGALLAIFGVSMLFVTVAFALAGTLPGWLSALIVAGVLLVAAGAMAAIGWSKRVKKPLDSTQKTIKEDVEWAKNRAA